MTTSEKSHSLGGLAAAWLFLGLASLLVSGLFAIILVVLRTPFLAQWLGHGLPFRTALVLHVDLSVAVWFLAMAGAFWSATRRESPWSWLAWGLAAAGVVTLLLSPLADAGVAVVNNYLPVVNAPLFLGGLGMFATGVAWQGGLSLWPGAGEGDPAVRWLARGAAVLVWLSLAVILRAWWTMPAGLSLDGHWFEALFWGGGHLLQFVHTLLMLAAWWVLLQPPDTARRWLLPTLLLGVAPGVAVLPMTWSDVPGSAAYHGFFTSLMSWTSWWPLLPMALVIIPGVKRSGAVLFSALLFLTGIVLGALIQSDNLVVTAHYHATVGAVTLSFMALASHWLGQRMRLGGVLYGGGLLLLVAGLCWLGMTGGVRKTIFSPPAEADWLALIPPLMVGAGGLVALLGLFAFLIPLLRVQIQRWLQSSSRAWSPVVLAMMAIALAGVLFQWLPSEPVPAEKTPAAVPFVDDPAVRLRFQQGAMMLHAGEFEHAVVAFHEVLAQLPTLPEAHLNMGYAMMGLERFDVARDFFLSAVELRPVQANAYYGLAEAYEALGELESALGAMRAFIHLTNAADPFLSKARAALWEWEARLGRVPVQKLDEK